MRDKSALVFLKPQYPHSSYQIDAWQALKGVPGTCRSFVDDRQIPINVRSDGGGDMKVTSACQSLQPPASLTPPQGGVIKQANPYIQFASHC
ncbi:hypothetical protein [Janthinobacterium sp. UMAB-56]|uniref:hypothetical protein n=1 Tax=Janthinobacterium sp. UMAB-56 TaxID=1365361 RepID=UPI001C587D28|nr:hypothetical protein [Janthinobacterium sp. UMAB-56]